jgi:hypothetical protein
VGTETLGAGGERKEEKGGERGRGIRNSDLLKIRREAMFRSLGGGVRRKLRAGEGRRRGIYCGGGLDVWGRSGDI